MEGMFQAIMTENFSTLMTPNHRSRKLRTARVNTEKFIPRNIIFTLHKIKDKENLKRHNRGNT